MTARRWMAAVLLGPIAPALACETGVTAAELARKVAVAEIAVGRRDASPEVAQVHAALPCATELLPGTLAARVHRLLGFHALRRGRSTEAWQALTAARSLDPSLRPPAPPEGPLALAWEAVRGTPPATQPVRPPKDLLLVLDGLPSVWMPQDRPVLVQLVVDEELPVLTAWLTPGERLPRPTRTAVDEARARTAAASAQGEASSSVHDGT